MESQQQNQHQENLESRIHNIDDHKNKSIENGHVGNKLQGSVLASASLHQSSDTQIVAKGLDQSAP